MKTSAEREFAGFVRTSSPTLLTTAWLLSGDPQVAEDLVQEAFERMYVRWPRMKTEDNPTAYARRVVVNLHTDRWRKRRREVLTDTPPADAAVEPESQHVDLVRALQQLPAREREVIVLRHYADLSEQATATTLGVSLGTVKSSGSRGLVRLRTLLEGGESHVVARP